MRPAFELDRRLRNGVGCEEESLVSKLRRPHISRLGFIKNLPFGIRVLGVRKAVARCTTRRSPLFQAFLVLGRVLQSSLKMPTDRRQLDANGVQECLPRLTVVEPILHASCPNRTRRS